MMNRSRINDAAHMGETIVCQSGEFFALSARSLHEAIIASHDVLPEGNSFAAGVEDCWKGYIARTLLRWLRGDFVSLPLYTRTRSRGSIISFMAYRLGLGWWLISSAEHRHYSRQLLAASWH
eukprot:2385393-Amphidinium_carterae.4